MNSTTVNAIRHSIAALAAAALVTACSGEAPLAPERDADLGSCENLHAPAGSKLASHLYATGVQIYRWNDTSWVFISPSAVLFADAAGKGTVGIHYSGPTWQGVAGSKVVGTVLQRCTPNPSAIPWLLLGAVSDDEPGIFQRTTFIQRVNTTGGNAPSTPGKITGEVTSVPYTAEYLFYRP